MNTVISYYPLALNITRKLAVVAGGGKVAQLKVRSLLRAGARVRVVSPELSAKLNRLYKHKKIQWVCGAVKLKDIRGAVLVIAATSDKKTNRNVSRWARNSGALVNVVSQPGLSSFISPAVFRKKEALVAVYTDGKSPALSRDLKNFLNKKWPEFLSCRHSIK